MKKNIKRYIVTAALPYANGPIHIGHLSGVYIPADIFVRYLRRKGKNVIFISGSDEHGIPITIRAKKEKISPKEVIDKYHFLIKKSFKKFGIKFDNYSRTSSKIHYKTASNFFKKLYIKNKLLEKNSEQFYDEKTNHFLADRYIIGTCPYCKNKEAYGDQCEKCGISLNSKELIYPRSVFSGKTPIFKKTKHWYLPLNKYENFIKKWISKKKYWKKNVYNQIKSWINLGLKPRSITRDNNWGIPIPISYIEKKVLYVWFEAPIAYISFTIEWARKNNKKWKHYWQNKHTSLIQFIGKDNIVFHGIIFPIMLKAHKKYILPDNIPANEFLNLENEKISTSKNWAIWLHEYLKEFPKQEDTLRYFLISNIPEKKDNNFSWKEFQIHSNSELVNILGNFINRTLTLNKKYFKGKIPDPTEKILEKDIKILKKIKKYPFIIGNMIENYNFRDALNTFLNLSRIGNKYLTQESPWKISKKNKKRINTILYVSLQIVGIISQLSEPFLPYTSKKLFKILNIKPINWNIIEKIEILLPGKYIGNFFFLFKKIEDIHIKNQIKKLKINKF